MAGMSGVSLMGSSTSYTDYGRFASGKKVQSAADGAAELSIIQKQESQIRGYGAGTNNIGSAQDMLNVSDGAMSGIGDYLQRMRALAVQASNTAVMSDADRANIQMEVDQLKQGISDIASQTQFNTKNLLDGTDTSFRIATDSNGSELTVNTTDSTLRALGIENFDVTKDFNLSSLDSALAKVNSGRSEMGAQSNRLGYAYNYNTNTSLNTTASKSRLEDLDFPKAISDQKKKAVLQEYSLFMQRKMQSEDVNRMRNLFM